MHLKPLLPHVFLYTRPLNIIKRRRVLLLVRTLFDITRRDNMSQQEILEVIKANPGIEQRDICKVLGVHRCNVSEFVLRLAKNGLIRRELYKVKTWTYKCYPAE